MFPKAILDPPSVVTRKEDSLLKMLSVQKKSFGFAHCIYSSEGCIDF